MKAAAAVRRKPGSFSDAESHPVGSTRSDDLLWTCSALATGCRSTLQAHSSGLAGAECSRQPSQHDGIAATQMQLFSEQNKQRSETCGKTATTVCASKIIHAPRFIMRLLFHCCAWVVKLGPLPRIGKEVFQACSQMRTVRLAPNTAQISRRFCRQTVHKFGAIQCLPIGA